MDCRAALLPSLVASLGMLLATELLAQAPVPIGSQFQVNSYISGNQGYPDVAMDPDGNFVIVWSSAGSSGTDPNGSVQGQRYDATGAALGTEFQVNSYTSDLQDYPSVGIDGDGNFVVVWRSYFSSGSDTDGPSVQARRFTAGGTPVGFDFQVNSLTTSFQREADVAVAPLGNFVVAWTSAVSFAGQDSSGSSVHHRRFDSGGYIVYPQVQVNSYQTNSQGRPAVGIAPTTGDFIVVWDSNGSPETDESFNSVQGRRHDLLGDPLADQFQVNAYTTGNQFSPSIAVDAAGRSVVTWISQGSAGGDDSSLSIQGRRYDADGDALGSDFQVNTYTTDGQNLPRVAVAPSGEFVVVWASDTPTNGVDIKGRLYDSSGWPTGPEFQVNTYTSNRQYFPSVAMGTGGVFVVAWHSTGSSGSDNLGYSVQAQLFRATAIFADGFETQNVLHWSSTQP